MELARILLLIASILGVVQGLMSLIGGIIASQDRNVDSESTVIPYAHTYFCGFVRYSTESKCNNKKMDRGWFKNVDKVQEEFLDYPGHKDSDLMKLIGYKAVICYAVICGILWIVAGCFSFYAYSLLTKKFAILSGILFVSGYIALIILFPLVWTSVQKIEDDCKPFYDFCEAYHKGAIRSSREFLAYSICSFISIFASIVLSFYAARIISDIPYSAPNLEVIKANKLADKPNFQSNNQKISIPRIDLDYFKNTNTAQNLLCTICQCVPDPRLAMEHQNCGKLFCKSCIETWMTKQPTCPTCKERNLTLSPTPISLKNTMLSFVVACPISSEKLCKWEGTWENLEKHYEICEFAQVQCRNGCGKNVARYMLDLHENFACTLVKTQCKYCTEKVIKTEIVNHENKCSKNPEAQAKCKFAYAGCKEIMKNKDLDAHYEKMSEYHADLEYKFAEKQQKFIQV